MRGCPYTQPAAHEQGLDQAQLSAHADAVLRALRRSDARRSVQESRADRSVLPLQQRASQSIRSRAAREELPSEVRRGSGSRRRDTGERRRCLPTDELHETFRDELWEAVSRARRPKTLNENAIRRLDGQLDRIRRLFELGEYDEETFILKRSEIKAEQQCLREQAVALQGQDDDEWCRVQLFDLLAAWDAADGRSADEVAGWALRADRSARGCSRDVRAEVPDQA
jgi:hypothetical protein